MNDFDWDVLQKKRIAQQAKYRKRGSKSKKCSLPSDGMTRKEWIERCGDLMVYNMGKPMGYEEYKAMPPEKKAEYLRRLYEKYGVGANRVAKDMFGVTPEALRQHNAKCGVNVGYPRRHKMKYAEIEAWERFVLGESDDGEIDSDEPEIDESAVAVEGLPKPDMTLGMVQLVFGGALDMGAVYNSLKTVLGDGRVGKLTVIYEEVNDGSVH